MLISSATILTKNGPGVMQFTRTLGANAFANEMVRLFNPALAVPYGTSVGLGRREAVLDTIMMLPPLPLAILVPTTLERRNGPLRLTAMTLSYKSSVCSASDGYKGDIPALFYGR